MNSLLREQPLLLLFVVGAAGSLLGSLRVRGFALGVAAVLFVGLALSALDPTLALPDIVPQLGLVLFVYSVGVAGGPAFFSSLGRDALRSGAVVLAGLTVAAVVTAALGRALHLNGATIAGLYAGSVTNTPALASVVEALRGAPAARLSDPVVGYSMAYPMGVLAVLLVMHLFRGARAAPAASPSAGLVTRTARITRDDVIGRPAEALARHEGWRVVFGRHERAGVDQVVSDLTVLAAGDLVTVVGTPDEVDRVVARLGDAAPQAIELDRSQLDFRRVFVSRRAVVGMPVVEVQRELARTWGGQITRIRRGDVDVLPVDGLLLEPGDRVRVLAPRGHLDALSRYFGDSYRAISEVDVVTVGVGIALGLLLGRVELSPLPGLRLSLGVAGGPLVVGLVLGRLVRTGPLTWSMPYSASLTLRQFGLLLFFAGVGTRSGAAFARTAPTPTGALLFGVGALATLLCALTIALLGQRVLGLGAARLHGVLAGAHTQPAALSFAVELADSDEPNAGYAQTFPLATIAKILIAQVILALFG
ncbi:MAG: TrkA C-terminal domain-containing protein [Deltaproteobacteria bacterium]|nr:TrkA C-terminal domain-containing protein [Myxococcales bacterium]MDP3218235.1 TrkA C-terminal domain-containing protein [Deltaproteobacteria bacterium]